ncbi:MAG TPA: FAD binding domain-containing protein [Gemmatimonadaceae bacterium]|nr:FAD binding domain-containing protein [Gemmatimonadaceae bacterium]
MRTAASSLELVRPRSVDEALRWLADEPSLVPIAGCTDVFVGLNAGTFPASRFLDLWPLEELREIGIRDGAIAIGALATHSMIQASPAVVHRVPMLAAACREIGGIQIQNRGTLGGNVANGSPAGDTLPVLAVAEAVIVLRSARRERRVPFTEFFTGYRKTVRAADELIVGFELPPLDATQWFRKVGTRAAQAISKVVMAVVGGERPRVAVGSVGPTVLRCTRTETALANGVSFEEAARILEEEIQPIDDIRSTSAYRRRVCGNLLRRFGADVAR